MRTTDPKKKSFADIFAQWEKTDSAKKAAAQMEKKDDSPEQPQQHSVSAKKLPVDGTLDLHGLTSAEAENKLKVFFAKAKNAGWRKVIIIHGKGIHSKEEPVLKKVVMDFIENSPIAGSHGIPGASEGGSGAVWVAIKK
ncbi:MAG: Smr/MutS family protein [Spirochaetia bacterium]|nr:Smr/MutS family protein [Spirochaetales bacterium]MBR5928139.1 Smr/MutS family protein [Spirochaetia bacterium]